MSGAAKYPRGSRVLYSGAWGSRAPVSGTVTGHGDKNGREVLDVTLDDGATHWGYLDQFAPLPAGWLAVLDPRQVGRT